MANIYKKQQVSDYAHNYYSAEGNFGQRMIHKAGEYEQEAEKKKAEAQNKYKNYLDLVTQDRFNDLIANPDLMGNPEAIKQEMGRIRDDMASGVNDEDVKTAYLGDTDKIIGHYTAKAAAHQAALKEKEKAAQEAQAKAEQRLLKAYDLLKLQNTFDFAAADLLKEYQANPQELNAQIDKLSADIASTIKDNESKLEFLKGVELKRNKFVIAAKDNLYNATEQNKRSTNVETLTSKLDDIQLIQDNIYSTFINDTYGDGAERRAQYEFDLNNAYEEFNQALYAKNPNGTNMFSDQDILKAKEAFKQATVNGFAKYYASIPSYQRVQLSEYMSSDQSNELLGKYIDSGTLNKMKEFVNKFDASVKKDESYGYTDEEATERAIRHSQTVGFLDNLKTSMYDVDKNGNVTKNLKGKTEVTDMLEYRGETQRAFMDGIISREEYEKRIGETVNDTLSLMDKYDAEKGFPDRNLGFVYKSVVKQVDPNDTMASPQKLYFLQRVYEKMKQEGLDPNKKEWSHDDPRFAKISKEVIRDYAQMQDPALLGKEVDSVVLGTNIFRYGKGAGKHNVPSNRELRKAPDGSVWAIQRDSNGNVVNKIKVR